MYAKEQPVKDVLLSNRNKEGLLLCRARESGQITPEPCDSAVVLL